VVSRIPKRDICRILMKQKEKLKHVQVQRVLRVRVKVGILHVDTGESDQDPPDEGYVSENWD